MKFILTLPAKKYFFLRVCSDEESIPTLKITFEMFVCVMFAKHPTIVALQANSFCKYLKLLEQILLIKLCLQCITHQAPYVLLRCDRNHADFANFLFINMQLLLKEVFLDKFSAKSLPRQIFCEKSTRRSKGQTTWFEEDT